MLQRSRIYASHIWKAHLYGSPWLLPFRSINGTSVRRRFSISSGGCQPPVDGTFHSSHIDADGKAFKFATVVVNSMEKGQSALPAWSQACSLVGTNVPTVAIAFVSKPTPSAVSAVEEVAQTFSEMMQTANLDNLSRKSKIVAPFIGCIADIWDAGAAGNANSPLSGDVGGEKKFGSPISSLPSGYKRIPRPALDSNEKVKRETAPRQGSGNCPNKQAASEYADDDDEEADFKALVGECTRWTRENPGVVSDDESLIFLEKELKTSKTSIKDMLDSLKHKKLADDKNEELPVVKEEEEAKANSSSLVKVEVKKTASSSGHKEGGGNVASSTEASSTLVSKAEEASSEGVSGESKDLSSEKDADKVEDDNYRMILCLGHMPDSKAVAFHTSTTGLPHLPDMEAAVTRNNPHMILLGAPGYTFPEFVQRLSIMFPESCRAGAFLAPLYNSPRIQRSKSMDKSKPLFLGTKQMTAGVVGLAISSAGQQGNVPVEAFTEFLRMSLGMARILGHTFFDNAISNSLFFPKNVIVERQATTRSAPVDPTSFLKRLNTYLIRHTKVQSQTSTPAASGGPQQDNVLKVSDGTSTCTTAVEIKSSDRQSSAASLAPTEVQRTESLEKMPLALFDAVLFPGWSMPLHIYEPRYRHLVRHCVEQGKPFGLTSYWKWEHANAEELIGTMANLKVYLFEKDCRSYIVAHGVQRFRVLDDRMWVQPGSFGLNMGQVEFFDDNECEEKEEVVELAKRVVELCRQLIPEAETVPGLVGSVTDPARASFAVGQILPVPTRVKRRWLSMVDTKFRLLEQMTFLNN